MSVDQVIESYPILDRQDVLGVLTYATQSLENERQDFSEIVSVNSPESSY